MAATQPSPWNRKTMMFEKKVKGAPVTEYNYLEHCITSEDCVVCYESGLMVKFLPCEHHVVCENCYNSMVEKFLVDKQKEINCVMCRSKVKRIMVSEIA